jgi:hypothetical protein
MYGFDHDTAVKTAGAHNRSSAHIGAGYNIGAVPNGGYVLAIAARAICLGLRRADPLTVTGHYLAPTTPGQAELRLDLAPDARRLATGSAVLVQDGTERVRALATCSDLARHQGASWTDARMPDVAPFADCVPAADYAPAPMPFHDVVDVRLDPAYAQWNAGGADTAELRGWLAFRDGRPADTLALLLFADAMPPPVFRVLGPLGWVPTLELTVHLRARPAPGPVAGVFRTRHLTSGLLEEDGTLWDSTGRLVALSRQLALVREPPAR